MLGTVWAWALLVVGGCQCRPELPPDSEPTRESEEEPPPPVHTADSGRPPPGACEVPEVEPNDTVQQGSPVLLERHACGAFAAGGDQDHWAFTLDQGGWVLARLQSADGSIADPTMLLSPADGSWAALRTDDPDQADATLLFPAPAGEYVLKASEQTFAGGDRFGYDLVVSEGKAPVSWTRSEAEPNDLQASAEPVSGGEAVFGTLSGNGALPDYDWFAVTIPPGKHTLGLAVSAYAEGSPGDLTLFLYDAGLRMLPEGCRNPCPASQPGCVPCAIEGGPVGFDRDPVGEYVSDGGEVVWIQVQEAASRESPASWYVLHVELEGS